MRVEGIAKKSDETISNEYFQMRSKDSQVAAWTSPQSEKITKEELENNLKFYQENQMWKTKNVVMSKKFTLYTQIIVKKLLYL